MGAHHIEYKRKSLNQRSHSLRHILQSNMSLETKLLIYKQIIRPSMTYRIQLWGSAKKSSISTLQSFQSINLQIITSALWFIDYHTLYKDRRMETLTELATCYFKKLQNHTQNYRSFFIYSP